MRTEQTIAQETGRQACNIQTDQTAEKRIYNCTRDRQTDIQTNRYTDSR
jgi:hypothetical protein